MNPKILPNYKGNPQGKSASAQPQGSGVATGPTSGAAVGSSVSNGALPGASPTGSVAAGPASDATNGQPAAPATQPNMTVNACIQWLCSLTPSIVDEGASFLSWQRANPASDEQVVSCIATLRQGRKRVWDTTPACRYGKGEERKTALPSGILPEPH